MCTGTIQFAWIMKINWSRSRAKVTTPAPAKNPGSGSKILMEVEMMRASLEDKNYIPSELCIMHSLRKMSFLSGLTKCRTGVVNIQASLDVVYKWLLCPGEPVPAAAGYAEGGGGEGDGASLRAVLLQSRQKGTQPNSNKGCTGYPAK